MYEKSELVELARFVKNKADEKRITDAFNGSWGDGNEGILRAQADAFISGLAGTLPTGWLSYYDEMQTAKSDPDKEAYLRYKAKHNL